MFGENFGSNSKKRQEDTPYNDILINPQKNHRSFNIEYMTLEELQKEADEKHADEVEQSQQNN